MDTPNASYVNQLWMEKLASPEEYIKVAQAMDDFIRDRLRETQFCRKIIPPINVTRADCQVSVNHDTLVKIVEIEPNSRAVVANFRGTSTAKIISAPRAEVGFWTVETERYQAFEQELQAYTMPITKLVEDNAITDMGEVEDHEFLNYCEACVQAVQIEANGGAVAYNRTNVLAGAVVGTSVHKGSLALVPGGAGDDFTVRELQLPDLKDMFKLLDRKRLRAAVFLISEPDYDDISAWTSADVGEAKKGEMLVDGFTYQTLLGKKFVRTIKSDILREGNIYCFTEPQFLGKFYILNEPKFFLKKEGNLITWWSWEDIGMALINIASVVKLELYRGSVTPGATDVGFADRMPMDLEDMFQENNRVSEHIFYPEVYSY